MSSKVRVAPELGGAAYRTDADTAPLDAKLKEQFDALVTDTRKKVARAYDFGSIASLAVAGEVALNWDPGTCKSVALTMMAVAALVPQILKVRDKNRLGNAAAYKQLLSIHVPEEAGGNRNAYIASRQPMSGENEGRTDERGAFYEYAGFLAMALTLLRLFSELQTGDSVSMEAMISSIALFFAAWASAYVVDKSIKTAKREFREGYAEFVPKIASQTRVTYEVASAGESADGATYTEGKTPKRADGSGTR